MENIGVFLLQSDEFLNEIATYYHFTIPPGRREAILGVLNYLVDRRADRS
jgi:hypothetical protein